MQIEHANKTFNSLPRDIIVQIIANLNPAEVFCLRLLSTELRTIVDTLTVQELKFFCNLDIFQRAICRLPGEARRYRDWLEDVIRKIVFSEPEGADFQHAFTPKAIFDDNIVPGIGANCAVQIVVRFPSVSRPPPISATMASAEYENSPIPTVSSIGLLPPLLPDTGDRDVHELHVLHVGDRLDTEYDKMFAEQLQREEDELALSATNSDLWIPPYQHNNGIRFPMFQMARTPETTVTNNN